MRLSLGHKLIFASLFCLTLALKVSDAVETAGQNEDDIVRVQLHEFLSKNGFDDKQPVEIFNPVAALGRDGACQVLIINAAPQGWHHDMLVRYARTNDLVFFVFRGRIYRRQPVWLTTLDHYWAVTANGIGLHIPIKLVLGVVASPTCEAQRLPWREVAEVGEPSTSAKD